MKTAKILKWATLLILVISLIVGLRYAVKWFNDSGEETPVAKMEPAKIIDIRPMVKLCSVELYEDIPVKGKIGSRHLFAMARMRGTISFDLEKIGNVWVGDTLVVTLPREIVEIRESTEPGSYKVIDTWNDKLLGSSNFTTAEENEIKRGAVAAWKEDIYRKGYVRRARSEAVRNLESMLRPFVGDGKVITIVDPIPDGMIEKDLDGVKTSDLLVR